MVISKYLKALYKEHLEEYSNWTGKDKYITTISKSTNAVFLAKICNKTKYNLSVSSNKQLVLQGIWINKFVLYVFNTRELFGF